MHLLLLDMSVLAVVGDDDCFSLFKFRLDEKFVFMSIDFD